MRSRRAALFVLLALAFALLIPAVAMASEPANDFYYGAEGPLASGVTKTESLATDYSAEDFDFYYFWSSGDGTATVDFLPPTGGDAVVGVMQYCAGFIDDSVLTPSDIGGDVHQEINLKQGLYYVMVDGAVSDNTYSLTVTGDTVTGVQQPNGVRPLGYVEVDETTGMNTKAGARVLKPRYDYDGMIDKRYVSGRLTADEDWYKFYVTNTSDVSVGSYVDTGYTGLYGGIFNSAGTWLGSTNNSAAQLHLTPGTYYVRWRYASTESPEYTLGVSGPFVTVAPYATMTAPYAPLTRGAGLAWTAGGTISPRHTDATTVSIQAYKYVSGKWVLKKTVPAAVSNYTTTAQKYRASMSLWAGKWALRAKHVCPKHLPSYSTWRYMTVK